MVAELGRIQGLLEALRDGAQPVVSEPMPDSPADRLAALFGMSAFERDVILLAAGVELDAEIAHLVAALQGGNQPRPTFGLALSVLPGPHWDALSPDGPIRRWRLVELEPGPLVAERPLHIDEAIVGYLIGTDAQSEQLDGLVRRQGLIDRISPSQVQLAADTAQVVAAIGERVQVVIDGDDSDGRLAVAAVIATLLERRPLVVRTSALPPPGPDLARTCRLIERELRLGHALAVIDPDGASDEVMDALLDDLESRVAIVLGRSSARRAGRVSLSRTVTLPDPPEARELWVASLGSAGADESSEVIDDVAQQFRLSAAAIDAIAREAATSVATDDRSARIRRLCRERARVPLDGLAERIEPLAGWDDLVLPEGHTELLQEIVSHVRHRTQVLERWGFGTRTTRGLGITALFAGESGTGKTLAAEVLARELGLDLYRIDLAATVSKYIGETEKNLRRVFDAAEASGAVLLFDEADALFGKRGEVRDAHDRYANLEVAYLLQRMEQYRGLAILTTNLRSNVDRAFLRRLRFVVQFPFPDAEQRAEIWRRTFPAQADMDDVAPERLARLNVSGGSISSIALGAAFAAAREGRATLGQPRASRREDGVRQGRARPDRRRVRGARVTAARVPVRIVIDELVLRGLSAHEARAAAAELESAIVELARGADASHLASRAVAGGRVSPVRVGEGSGGSVGQAVAGAVWGYVAGERR